MLAKPLLDRPLASLWVVVGSLVVGSLYMAAADRCAARTDGRDLLGRTDSMLIGGSQILALLLPGFSRSGVQYRVVLAAALFATLASGALAA